MVAHAGDLAIGMVSANTRVLDALASELVAVETLEGEALDRFLSQVKGSGGESLGAEDLALIS